MTFFIPPKSPPLSRKSAYPAQRIATLHSLYQQAKFYEFQKKLLSVPKAAAAWRALSHQIFTLEQPTNFPPTVTHRLLDVCAQTGNLESLEQLLLWGDPSPLQEPFGNSWLHLLVQSPQVHHTLSMCYYKLGAASTPPSFPALLLEYEQTLYRIFSWVQQHAPGLLLQKNHRGFAPLDLAILHAHDTLYPFFLPVHPHLLHPSAVPCVSEKSAYFHFLPSRKSPISYLQTIFLHYVWKFCSQDAHHAHIYHTFQERTLRHLAQLSKAQWEHILQPTVLSERTTKGQWKHLLQQDAKIMSLIETHQLESLVSPRSPQQQRHTL